VPRKKALRGQRLLASVEHCGRALANALLDVARDLVAMLQRDERAHVDAFAIARADF
jgi:hypothetical protein